MMKILQLLCKGSKKLALGVLLYVLLPLNGNAGSMQEITFASNRNTESRVQSNTVEEFISDVRENKVNLQSIFDLIEEKFHVNVVYDGTIFANYTEELNVNEKAESLKDLLQSAEQNSNLRFKKINNTVYVKEKPDLMLLLATKLQDKVVTGTVKDESGTALVGVSVMVEGSSGGTSTNNNGEYSLSAPENSVLVFSMIGYTPQRIIVGNGDSINILLIEDNTFLDDVVVVGYGTQRRSDVTGSIGSVSSAEIEDEPVLQVGQALQGKIAGLQVSQNSGTPGSGLLIRVRGTGTVNNAEPLYVVDGNPNIDPRDLAPDQIENIQVLKSASAAAIYGAQGANGVVLITTKQGKVGPSQLDVSFSQGMQQIQRHFPVTNAREYAILYNEGLVNAGAAPLYANPDTLGVGTDWQKEVFRVAPMTDLSVSASGGSETSRFFFSTGYQNQEGIVKGSGFDRIILRVNSSHNINKAIKIGQNLSGSMAKYKEVGEFNFGSTLGSTLTANPEVPVKMPDGGWGYSETSLNSGNPLASIHYMNNSTRRPVLNGNVYADITILKDLVFRSQYNFNIGYSEYSSFTPVYRISSSSFNEVARLTENTTRFREQSWANTLTYAKSLGEHSFDLLGGVTSQTSYRQNISASAAGLPDNGTDNPNLRYFNLATQGYSIGGGAGEWGILSYLGRINYNYAGKYFSTVNFRVDGSSRFGTNNKYGYFPSFSVGWKLSEENFLKEAGWINNLMLRGGWGSLGNQNSLPNYAFANLVTPNQNYTFGTSQTILRGQAPTGLGNPNLKWEATKELNLGLDFTGFDGKVTAAFDYYNKKTTDMLLQVPLVDYSGIQNFPFVNGGDVINKGVEFLLGYQNTTPSGFEYSISANVAHNRNEVTKLSNAGSALFQWISFVQNVNITQVGSPIASYYGWKTDGIFQSQAEVDNHAFQTSGTAPGDFRFVDINGDGVINAEDQTIIGSPWPKLTFGLNSSFAYKNFDLKMQFQGVSGNDIYMAYKFRTEGSNFFNYTRNIWDNRWTGPNTSNSVPRMNTNDPNNNMRSSEYYLEDGSYIRLKNVMLGYKIPKSVVNLRNFRVFASVQNALTITKYPGFDPEIGTNRNSDPLYIGIDETNYPVPRIYTIGINVGL